MSRCPYCRHELPPVLSDTAVEVFGALRETERPLTVSELAVRTRLPWRQVTGAMVALRRRQLAVRRDQAPPRFAVPQ